MAALQTSEVEIKPVPLTVVLEILC